MNVRRVVRVGGTVVLVTGTAVLAVAAPAGAEPDDATHPRTPAQDGWFDDVDALADACARQGDAAGAANVHDLAAMYHELAGRTA